ncbi:MAG TPA: CHAP domain-containing protein [Brumimicrobium sp.]|nr:CHAP domain-containing protein [Brumimicrobium sp.]
MKAFVLISGLAIVAFFSFEKIRPGFLQETPEVGKAIDSLNNVLVYYNGDVGTVIGRNTRNGYNLGLKFQCVEFVKRYYYEFYNHEMPDSYGHALSFYNPNIKDGQLNSQRALMQFSNPSATKPEVGDLLVMDATLFNPYGHVAIISKVEDNEIEIIQQNPGPNSPSREYFDLKNNENSTWKIENDRILGWLRKEK